MAAARPKADVEYPGLVLAELVEQLCVLDLRRPEPQINIPAWVNLYELEC